jgi:hypothetical protein
MRINRWIPKLPWKSYYRNLRLFHIFNQND